MKTVTATAVGFYGHLRNAGESFLIPKDEEPGNWMRLAEEVVVAVVPVAPEATSFASFQPAAQTHKVKHVAGGNFAVIDEQGEQVGELFKKSPTDNAKAKISAQQEADRLNASPVEAVIAQADESPGDNLPDA